MGKEYFLKYSENISFTINRLLGDISVQDRRVSCNYFIWQTCLKHL